MYTATLEILLERRAGTLFKNKNNEFPIQTLNSWYITAKLHKGTIYLPKYHVNAFICIQNNS